MFICQMKSSMGLFHCFPTVFLFRNILVKKFLLINQVIVAAELLKNADELVKCKIHPTSIISGYRLACK